jgi:hypothetical protein
MAERFFEESMANSLTEYLTSTRCGKFTPEPMYSAQGDFLTFFFQDDDAYERRVDELLTIYLSESTDELVGCKIKGVSEILKTLGDFGVMIRNKKLMLSMLFLAGMAVSKTPESKEKYEMIGRRTKDIPLNAEELCLV